MRTYRALLHLFPASFRAEYSEEMCTVFAARRLRENALLLWVATILDVLSNAARVHTDLLRQDLHHTRVQPLVSELRRQDWDVVAAVGTRDAAEHLGERRKGLLGRGGQDCGDWEKGPRGAPEARR